MHSIKLLSLVTVQVQALLGDDAQTAIFKACVDFTRQVTARCIWLDDGKR